MAAELQYRHSATGSTMRATIRKEQTVGGKAQLWNGSAWEDMTVANWANYLVTLTETPASSYIYIGTMPAVAVGWYYVDIYSGTAISSTLEATLFGYWDGTNIILGGADTRQAAGTAWGSGAITAAVIADAAIDNATFAADVGSTAYATNIIALAVRKVLDELNLDHLISGPTPIDGKAWEAALRYALAVLAGKVSGAGTGTESFFGLDGVTERVRVSAETDGDRTAVTYDPV